jgi:hypothetical protein
MGVTLSCPAASGASRREAVRTLMGKELKNHLEIRAGETFRLLADEDAWLL